MDDVRVDVFKKDPQAMPLQLPGKLLIRRNEVAGYTGMIWRRYDSWSNWQQGATCVKGRNEGMNDNGKEKK